MNDANSNFGFCYFTIIIHQLLITVRKTFLKELGLWQKLRHPNIVQFLGVLKDSDRLIFLTEYLRNVSMFL